MKWIKRIFIAIGILILVGAGSFVLYGVAYTEGETAGYEDGYSIGHEAGYTLGKQDGYGEGYISGKQDGYNEGYTSGRADGYEEGYSLGKADGYEAGYAEGMEAGLGHGYTLRDPTYKEVITFLRQDKTDKNKYVEDTYDCTHFTRDVSNNAEQQGLRCAAALIDFPDSSHVIVAFNTIDKGLVYFEPQFDDEVKVALGKSYSQMNDFQGSDDTIIDIVVIW